MMPLKVVTSVAPYVTTANALQAIRLAHEDGFAGIELSEDHVHSLARLKPRTTMLMRQYSDDMRRRLRVRPGMTGLWQVSGRSDLNWAETVRLDLRRILRAARARKRNGRCRRGGRYQEVAARGLHCEAPALPARLASHHHTVGNADAA